MEEPARRPRWWLIATAAVLAVLTLYYYTDSWIIVVVFFAALGTFVAYQMRARNPSSYACVRCGAKLNPNARQCNTCGGAAWTIKN
jgi:ribosomal protein L40E